MKHIRELLEDADPLRHEPELSAADAEGMRRAIVSSSRSAEQRISFWPRAFALAAAILMVVAIGALGVRRQPAQEKSVAPAQTVIEPDAGERRQLQFSTPGGTRIIWTLDPHFKLEGVAP